MKYLALSYVWGESGLAHSGEMLINAPQTVKDAMYATKRLGQRYLWVDRYRIPQEGNERHVHIANMNSIYEAAYVTNRLLPIRAQKIPHILACTECRSRATTRPNSITMAEFSC